MDSRLISLRMRASLCGHHLCGAERIVAEGEVVAATTTMVTRAMQGAGALPDEVHCSLERLDPASIRLVSLPDVATFEVSDWQSGRRLAKQLLTRAGVSLEAASFALDLLAAGPGPDGTVMRGAVIMNARTGERLETDAGRGVRVSRMDLEASVRPAIESMLAAAGLGHHRVAEALVLAAKVLSAPGIVAEVCWSDDPAYTTGYVADPQYGYQRIAALKESGDLRGGRVFFVDPETTLDTLGDYLEFRPVLCNALGRISPPTFWSE